MSFEFKPNAGTVSQLESELNGLPAHEREEFVLGEVKKAIDHIVTALGGYLSLSCNGNINPVAGETGDLVNIYITSLPVPPSAPVAAPLPPQEGLETPAAETAPENTEIPTAPVPPLEPVIAPTNPESLVSAAEGAGVEVPVVVPAAGGEVPSPEAPGVETIPQGEVNSLEAGNSAEVSNVLSPEERNKEEIA